MHSPYGCGFYTVDYFLISKKTCLNNYILN